MTQSKPFKQGKKIPVSIQITLPERPLTEPRTDIRTGRASLPAGAAHGEPGAQLPAAGHEVLGRHRGVRRRGAPRPLGGGDRAGAQRGRERQAPGGRRGRRARRRGLPAEEAVRAQGAGGDRGGVRQGPVADRRRVHKDDAGAGLRGAHARGPEGGEGQDGLRERGGDLRVAQGVSSFLGVLGLVNAV